MTKNKNLSFCSPFCVCHAVFCFCFLIMRHMCRFVKKKMQKQDFTSPARRNGGWLLSLLLHIYFLFPDFIFCHLYNNTDHSAIGIVHNLLHRVLQLHLAFVIHHGYFVADSVFHQLADCLAKNIGVPDTVRRILSFFYVLLQSLRLLSI